jgi:uncharacterized protein (TIGR02271 family)
MELLGEALRVFKDKLERGEVTVRKELVTETQLIEVPVTREELVIERACDGKRRRVHLLRGEKQIRIPLWEERVRIERRPVVREVVTVGKRQIESVEEVSSDLQREQLHVSTEGKAASRGADDRAA